MSSYASALKKAEATTSLPLGWDHGSGGPSSVSALAGAQAILTALLRAGCDRFDAVPGQDGRIVVFGLAQGLEVEASCDGDHLALLYVRMPDGSERDEADLSYTGALAIIRGLDWQQTKSCTWSAYNVIHLQRAGSQAKLSLARKTGVESRSSARNALGRKAGHSAGTFKTFTSLTALDRTRPSSGDSERQIMELLTA